MLLYETLSQPVIFLIILLVGFACGLIFDARNYICFLCNKNKVVCHLTDFFAGLLSFAIFFLSIGKLNFGQLRVYLALGFAVGLIIERFSVGLIIAKVANWCYTLFKGLVNKITNGKQKKNEQKTFDN